MIRISLFTILLLFLSCQKQDEPIYDETLDYISAVDISSFPEIAAFDHEFYNIVGQKKDFLDILKENGVNTIRLRLWVNPENEHSGFEEVDEFAEILTTKGFKIWLSLHYSDTWADPGQQHIPALWQNVNFENLQDSVYQYTTKVVQQIKPNYIQLGNEINSGFLHPYGHIDNLTSFKKLLQSGIQAVRDHRADTQIILHYAGITNAFPFFEQMNSLNYDMIGLSYYPIWHGKSLVDLQNSATNLSATFNKNIVIAETAYPFSLDWNDWTNNIVGLEEELILPDYPASPEGQKNFLTQIKSITQSIELGSGFCYWGAELIAWKGQQATDASPWENQALFDFNNHAVPALEVFKNE